HGVDVAFDVFFENAIERGFETQAWRLAIHRSVLRAVGEPEVRDARSAELAAHFAGDFATAPAVLDPEIADARVGMRHGEAVDELGMREAGRAEVEAKLTLAAPVHPALEMLDRNGVALDPPFSEVAVDRVEVQPVFAGDQRVGDIEI